MVETGTAPLKMPQIACRKRHFTGSPLLAPHQCETGSGARHPSISEDWACTGRAAQWQSDSLPMRPHPHQLCPRHPLLVCSAHASACYRRWFCLQDPPQ